MSEDNTIRIVPNTENPYIGEHLDFKYAICSVCDKSMTDGDVTLIGMTCTISNHSDFSNEPYERLIAPYKLGKTYHVCFPCWFKALGVNP